MNLKALGPIALAGMLLASSLAFAADPPSDSWLTTKAKIKLLTTDGVDGTSVHVDTVKGVVTLHGKVKTDLMRQRAIEAVKIPGVSDSSDQLSAVTVARSVSGVRAVQNDLKMDLKDK